MKIRGRTAFLAVLALIAAVVMAGCGGAVGAATVDTNKAESMIRPELQRQLRDQLGDATITVTSVDCIAQSDATGKCTAEASDSTGESTHIGIDLSVDPSTGDAIWQVAS
jgi:hypothetical protein